MAPVQIAVIDGTHRMAWWELNSVPHATSDRVESTDDDCSIFFRVEDEMGRLLDDGFKED